MELGPRQVIHRAACDGVQVRLGINPDESWIVIRAPGTEPRLFDIPDDQVAAVTAEMQAIGNSPERFKAFVSTIEAQFSAAPAGIFLSKIP